MSLLSFLFYRYFKQRNTILENEKTIQQQKIIDLEKEKQLQATESILKGQEEERSRIAKDLHDGLGGLLSGVKYSLNNMKENVILSSENATSFERTVDMLDSGIQELRRVAHNMMPENLIKFGLDTALKDYCTSISNTGKLNINYSSFGMNNFNTETNVSITVYRVIQELINNSMKHANATESIVQLVNENNILHITVEDNGKGFDVKNINNFKGAGWTNIQNRITYLKGKINVDSSEQNGTSITIEIPIT
ncbi:MAG: sensor histidine kinase [Saprospirales bacterium]|nr:sensor histidine kinase [Saprospirales bacterium]